MRHHFSTILVLFGFVIFNVGCSTSDVNIFDDSIRVEHPIAINQLITPETSGHLGGGRAVLGTYTVSQVQLVDDIDSTNFSTDPNTSSEGIFLPLVEIGLLDRIDLFYNQGFGIKLQAIGEPKYEATEGFSLAVAYTSLTVDSEVDTSDTTGGVKKADAEVEGSGWKANVIAGYRKSPRMLFYGGIFYQDVKVDNVHVYQTNNTNFTFEGDVTSGSGSAYGLNMGFQFNTEKKIFGTFQFTCGAELAYGHVEWERDGAGANNSVSDDPAGIGGQVGFIW